MHRSGKVSWQRIGVLVLVLLFVVVVLQNTQVVRIQPLFWALSMSRIILLCFALFVGFAVGYWAARREKGRKKTHLIQRAKGDPS
ncbi:LapA family protein [Candidatus Bipolaricaulota bacterium]